VYYTTGAPPSVFSTTFTTGSGPDLDAPRITGIDPPSGTSGVAPGGPFTVHFSKPVSSAAPLVLRLPDNANTGIPFAQVFSADWQSLIITVTQQPGSNNSLPFPGGYLTVSMDPAAIKDFCGNHGAGAAVTATYITSLVPGGGQAVLLGTFPADGATGVPTNTNVIIRFDRGAASLMSNGGINWYVQLQDATTSGASIPAGALTPNHKYVAALFDAASAVDPYGLPFPPVSFSFTTGAGPDVATPSTVLSNPRDLDPPLNGVIGMFANVSFAPLNVLGSWQLVSDSTVVPLTPQLSSDGQVLTFQPATPLPPNTCYQFLPVSGNTNGLIPEFFLTEGSGVAPLTNVCVGAKTVTAPITIVAQLPEPGARFVPMNVSLHFKLSQPAGVPTNGHPIRLSTNGRDVPGDISFQTDLPGYALSDSTMVYFTPRAPLQPSTVYQVMMSGLADWAGNVLPDTSFTFTTEATSQYDQTGLTCTVSPASGTAIGATTPVVMTLNYPVGPPFVIDQPVPMQVDARPIPPVPNKVYSGGRPDGGGTILTLTPLAPYPPVSTAGCGFSVYVDFYGGFGQCGVNYTKCAPSDRTPPVVTGTAFAWEPRSNVVGGILQVLQVNFSKPMNRSTVTSQSLLLYSGGNLVAATDTQFSSDLKQLSMVLPLPSPALTLVLTSAIQDNQGNPLTPYRADLGAIGGQQPGQPSYNSSLRVLTARPLDTATAVAPSSPLIWYLSRPATLDQIESTYMVFANDTPVDGQFEIVGDGSVMHFTPNQPLPAGSNVWLYASPLSGAHGDYTGFQVAQPSTGPLVALNCSPCALVTPAPPTSFVEIEFSQPVQAGQSLVTLSRQIYVGVTSPVPVAESVPQPNILRLTPASALADGQYVLTLRPDVNWTQAFWTGGGYATTPRSTFTVQSTVTPGQQTPLGVAPGDGFTGVPRATLIQMAFDEPLNAARADSAQVHVWAGLRRSERRPLADGSTAEARPPSGEIPFTAAVIADNSVLQITPLQNLNAGELITVSVTGLEDRLGRPVPARTWSFTTGTDNLATSSNGDLATISQSGANSVAYAFDTPGLFGSAGQPVLGTATQAVGQSATSVQSKVRLSADLQTVQIMVSDAHPGFTYSTSLGARPHLDGMNGLTTSESLMRGFTVPFAGDDGPPSVSIIAPADGLSNVPVNVQLGIRFDRMIDANSLGGVHLESAAGTTALTPVLPWQIRNVVRLVPVQLLDPQTSYRLVVEGVRSVTGAAMPAAVSASFTTSDTVLAGGCSFTYGLAKVVPLNFKPTFLASVPINTTTLPDWATMADGSLGQYDVEVFDGGASATLTFDPPLAAGATGTAIYGFSVVDLAGDPCGQSSSNWGAFTLSNALSTPTSVVVSPQDGANNVSPGELIAAVVSGPFILPSAGVPFLQVTSGGQPISGLLTAAGNGHWVFIQQPLLTPATSYQIQIGRIIDLAGNITPPRTFSFETGPSGQLDYRRMTVLSLDPADGAVGVPLNEQPSFTADSPLNPACPISYTAANLTKGGYNTAGSWTAAGSVATFVPDFPLLGAATYSLSVNTNGGVVSGICNMSGEVLDKSYKASFTTEPEPDNVPPTVVALSPPAGTVLQEGQVVVRFSKRVIVNASNLYLTINGRQVNQNPVYDTSDPRVVYLSALVSPISEASVVGTAAIVDNAGNAIQPFQYNYANTGASVGVKSISPATAALAVSPRTDIVISFSDAMNPATIRSQNFVVAVNSQPVTGSLVFSNLNQTLTFAPDQPYPAGATVEVFLHPPAADIYGGGLTNYYSWFQVAGIASGQDIRVADTNFTQSAELEVQFDHAVEAASVNAASAWLRLGRQRISGMIELDGDRVLIFHPDAQLKPGAEYVLTIGRTICDTAGNESKAQEFAFVVGEAESEPRVENAKRVQFGGQPAIRLSYSSAASLRSSKQPKLLSAGGATIESRTLRSTDGKTVYLLPLNAEGEPAASRSQFDVEVEGVRQLLTSDEP
jgi:hypothetical protein